jgi:hypothetical protein
MSTITWPALKADNSSLKSSCVRGLPLQRVKLKVEVHYGANPFVSRQALPGAIFVRLHRFQALVTSDPFVQFTKVAQSAIEHTPARREGRESRTSILLSVGTLAESNRYCEWSSARSFIKIAPAAWSRIHTFTL